jgi:CubicO group peptidase (beta-lactamase class C family)
VGAYQAVAADPDLRTAHGLLIVKDGWVVGEGYFNGWSRERPKHVKSVTKSVLSLLIGIAIDEGRITGPEQKLSAFYPQLLEPGVDPRKRDIALSHALSMSTGLKWLENMEGFLNISWDPNLMFVAPDPAAYVLSRPMEDIPGGHLHYSSGSSQLLAVVLHKATGQTPLQYARQKLFDPLAIPDPAWRGGRDGLNWGGVGLHLTVHDMAKIGQLTLQRGVWGKKRIVSEDWLAISTREHMVGHPHQRYGFHWWTSSSGWSAQGYGGQYIFVRPAERLVVVFIAREDTPVHIDARKIEMLIEQDIVPALTHAD